MFYNEFLNKKRILLIINSNRVNVRIYRIKALKCLSKRFKNAYHFDVEKRREKSFDFNRCLNEHIVKHSSIVVITHFSRWLRPES